MTTEKFGSEVSVSLSGSPIYRHGEPRPWTPASGEECVEQISAHIEKHLGLVETVFHEIVSDRVHIDVHIVKPTPDFPFIRLVTSGMSDLPMATPSNPDIPRFVELLITLPPYWRVDQESFNDESWYWPMRLLKALARLPHAHETWLGWGHTVPNGDPPEPYAYTTGLCGAIILPSVSVPSEFETLTIDAKKTITFYAVVPLFEGEMNFKLRAGSDELLKKFNKNKVNDIVCMKRKDVTKRVLGFW